MPFRRLTCARKRTRGIAEFARNTHAKDIRMISTVKNVFRNDEGATMVEYGIMVALIAAVCIAVVSTLGQSVNNAFSNVNASI